MPDLLELLQQAIGTTHGVGVAGYSLRAAMPPLGHQVSALQHGHVFLNGCKRHSIARGQLADGRVGVHHASEDIAARGVGQGPKQAVQVVCRRLTTYNHLVVG